MKTLDLGNNERITTGIAKNSDGTFTAMTYSASKTFKTLAGAEKWLARRFKGLPYGVAYPRRRLALVGHYRRV